MKHAEHNIKSCNTTHHLMRFTIVSLYFMRNSCTTVDMYKRVCMWMQIVSSVGNYEINAP